MNNDQEKITVINTQKPLLPKPVIILLIISVIAIILLATLYLQKSFFKQNKPSPTPIHSSVPAPSKSPKKLDNNRIPEATGGAAPLQKRLER